MRTPSLDISKTPFEMVITVGTRYGMYVVIIYFFRAKSKVTTDADDFFSINIKTTTTFWPTTMAEVLSA
jgi:hypothetical protein